MKKLKIRPLTEEERKYTYAQSTQLDGQTGNIGYLRGDFGSAGNEFFITWIDRWQRYKTDGFKAELDGVVNALRSGEYGLLRDRTAMTGYVREQPDSLFGDGAAAGFRVNTEEHTFLIRCNPVQGDYNFYCYCYVSEFLDRHMANARQGIRFIDPHYKELFRIPDGGKIAITKPGGEPGEKTCRFVDEYHTEISGRIFHICEFAEAMQRCGNSYGPAEEKSMGKEPPGMARQ